MLIDTSFFDCVSVFLVHGNYLCQDIVLVKDWETSEDMVIAGAQAESWHHQYC